MNLKTYCARNLSSCDTLVIVALLKEGQKHFLELWMCVYDSRLQQDLEVVIEHFHALLQHSSLHVVECLLAWECQLA